jgi:hypothetical protein
MKPGTKDELVIGGSLLAASLVFLALVFILSAMCFE